MKFILLLLIASPIVAISQQTVTSIGNGSASNPLNWDCFCFPSTNDDIIINHNISLDVSWLINGGGSITVNSGGKLLQSGMRDLLIDGAGSSYTNNGISSINNIAIINGGSGTNSGSYSMTQALYIGSGSSFNNSGLLDGLDSVMTEGMFTNSGTFYMGNFLNTGQFLNSGVIASDSMGNTGSFSSIGGYMSFAAFGNSGTFNMTNAGWMEVEENWFNIGDFTLGNGLYIYARNDFFNGDTLGGFATLTNDGIIEVSNNFYNGWDLDGSGKFCIANESYNAGTITGTLDICDNTGIDFDFNVGTIAGTITYCQPGCYVSIDENEISTRIYPNPSNGELTIESNMNYSKYTIYSISGSKLIDNKLEGKNLQLSGLAPGTYILELIGLKNTTRLSVVIK